MVYGDPTAIDTVRSLVEPAAAPAPHAIVCSNDQTAALLCQTLARIGKSIPQDVAIVGFDDVNYSTLLTTPLTTMRQPTSEIGKVAVQAMFERLKSADTPPRKILLNAELIIRQSCGASWPYPLQP